MKQPLGRNACLCYGRQICRNRPTGLSRVYPVKTNIEWGRCGFIQPFIEGLDKSAPRRSMNTTQRGADHLPGGRQERSGSANALERRFVAQAFVFSWLIYLIFKIRKPVCQQTGVVACSIVSRCLFRGIFERFFGGVPESVQFGQFTITQNPAGLFNLLLDVLKAATKFSIAFLERHFRVNI